MEDQDVFRASLSPDKPMKTDKTSLIGESPPIGYGINNSLNQNELIIVRKQNNNASNNKPFNPSNEDILDMIDANDQSNYFFSL